MQPNSISNNRLFIDLYTIMNISPALRATDYLLFMCRAFEHNVFVFKPINKLHLI